MKDQNCFSRIILLLVAVFIGHSCTTVSEDEIREQLVQELKPEVRNQLKNELKEELGTELYAELREEIKHEIIEQEFDSLYSEIRASIKEEYEPEIRPELRAEIKEEQRTAEYSELREEIKQELGSDLYYQLRREIRNELKAELQSTLSAELRTELKNELRSEVKNELRAELESELTAQLQNELKAELLNKYSGGAIQYGEIDGQTYVKTPKDSFTFWQEIMDQALMEKYKAVNGRTFCNVFLGDTLTAHFNEAVFNAIFPDGVLSPNQMHTDWQTNPNLIRLHPDNITVPQIQQLANEDYLIVMSYTWRFGHLAIVGNKGLTIHTIPPTPSVEGESGDDLSDKWMPIMVQAGTYTGITSMVFASNDWLKGDNYPLFQNGVVRYYLVKMPDF